MNEIDKLKAKQAELARELELVGKRIGKLETTEKYRIGEEFVPGWTIACIELNSDGDTFKKILKIVQETNGEIAMPKTRYNWPEIIKEYPEAQWASTDRCGREDYWKGIPKAGDFAWGMDGYGTLGFKRHGYTKDVRDWRDSLEKRPDLI